MSAAQQFDLFAAPAAPAPWACDEGDDRTGWESRVLSDLTAGPALYCPAGFMGHVCERLVARGLLTSEDAGFMGPPIGLDGKPVTPKKGYRPEKIPQRLYRLVAHA